MTIDTSPFEVMIDYSLQSLSNLFLKSKLPVVKKLIQKLQNIRKEAQAANKIAQQKTKD